MRRIALVVLVALAALSLVVAAAVARDGERGGQKAFLTGYEEVVGGPGTASTGSVSTLGKGRLTLRVRDDGIHYRLRYEQMEGGTVFAAHIHFAQRHVGGGIIADLCGGNEAPCTTPNGDITGVITPAEIKGPADQGIEPAAPGYPEAVRAIRAGATYANVHSTPRFPEGEIRGQIGRGHGKGNRGRD
jgi:hypothetical protein